MKKLFLLVLVMAASLFADGLVVGGEFGYAKVNSELTTNIGSAEGDTKSKSLTGKLGYSFGDARVLGYVTSEKYNDDMVVYNEGSLISYGAELDYVQENLFIGAILGVGSKDFDGTDVDFIDYGARVGYIHQIDNANIEIGVQYKIREYDSYQFGAVTLDLEDEIIGLFIGINFNL